MTDPIRHHDITTVGYGVAALNRFPGGMLPFALYRLIARQPPDSRWIKKNFGALHCSQARGFRIPLIPANEHADLPITRLPRAKPEITGRKIKLLVIVRVI